MPNKNKLPVTLLSGFLGSGKTSLLNHLLSHRQELKVAVIVNDMSEVNIDAATLRETGGLSRMDEQLVEFSNGCICCTLREDLLAEVARMAGEARFDYLLIESTGISEPMPVAATFAMRDELGFALNDIAQLDTLVTVVDAASLLRNYESIEMLCEQGEAASEEDERTLVDLLVDQIEFADVIVLNKCDLVTTATRKHVRAIIAALNSKATIVETEYGRVEPTVVLDTGRFDFETATQTPGWFRALSGETHTPETEEYGITSFVYQRRRPFHPERLFRLLHNDWPDVLRSKGFFWLATRPEWVGEISHAGNVLTHQAAGFWWNSNSADSSAPLDTETCNTIHHEWHSDYGDRRQEIVFIGIDMDTQEIIRRLDRCLLTEAECMTANWRTMTDPFPAWRINA